MITRKGALIGAGCTGLGSALVYLQPYLVPVFGAALSPVLSVILPIGVALLTDARKKAEAK